MSSPSLLIITADDYGYHRSYDRGILEAAGAGAVDAVSAMVLRPGIEPGPLLETGVEIGLHLELAAEEGRGAEDGAAVAALRDQLETFERLFRRPAAYLDGHHHCHAEPPCAAAIAEEGKRRRLFVRSVDRPHRTLLRRLGVVTADRLVGRLSEEAPAALPPELEPAVEGGGELPPGTTEWMVHPGHADSAAGSSYDRAREEDLDLLLALGLDPALSASRRSHLAALG